MTKSTGITESESRLAYLCENTFLHLWSHPNLFSGVGKELCDLLVIFGNHVIIFSDKSCRFNETIDTCIAWPRWRRKAIDNSAKQIIGAERRITSNPTGIYLDPRCTKRLPLPTPNPADMIFHRIVVASGAMDACIKHFNGGSGSLMLEYHNTSANNHGTSKEPFIVDVPVSDRSFIHVLDEVTLNIVLREFDTITDLIEYLHRKETFIRSMNMVMVPGEEELVAFYLRNYKEGAGYSFDIPKEHNAFSLEEGFWADLVSRPEYRDRFIANRKSYLWDHVIDEFGKHILEGTLALGRDRPIQDNEYILNILASERRVSRRILSEALGGIVDKSTSSGRYIRTVASPTNRSLVYVMLALGKKHIPADDYRKIRTDLLGGYMCLAGDRFREAETIVGIATDGDIEAANRSHDIALLDLKIRTPEHAEAVKEWRDILKIPDDTLIKMSHYSTIDFPTENEMQRGTPLASSNINSGQTNRSKNTKRIARLNKKTQRKRKKRNR